MTKLLGALVRELIKGCGGDATVRDIVGLLVAGVGEAVGKTVGVADEGGILVGDDEVGKVVGGVMVRPDVGGVIVVGVTVGVTVGVSVGAKVLGEVVGMCVG